MNRGTRRGATPVGAVLAVVVLVTACGGGGDDPASSGTGGAQINATLNASGATFPQGFYEVVIDSFQDVQPGITVNYAGGGSGQGRQNLQDGVVDFAGSDGSGTTENFTKYLVAAAPNTWTLRSGATVEWPSDTQAGNGNQGVAQIVKSTEGAIGYVDLSDARASGLQFARVKNKSGNLVAATLEATTAALEGAQVNPDLTYNPLNADGAAAYPIAAPTWILVYTNQTDNAKGEALKAFLRYLLTDGQRLAEDVDYAPLPPSLQQRALAQVDSIVVPA